MCRCESGEEEIPLDRTVENSAKGAVTYRTFKEKNMYRAYDENTATLEERTAWILCQIIDDDAPLRWSRYLGVVGFLANNDKFIMSLLTAAGYEGQIQFITQALERKVRRRFENIINGAGLMIPRMAVKIAVDDLFKEDRIPQRK